MKVVEPKEYSLDDMAMKVFLEAINLAGGPRKLMEYRRLTWLPSLMEAAYSVVLANEEKKSEDEIAAFLGLARPAVRNILRANPEDVMRRLEGRVRSKSHVAGGLAKLAYQRVKGVE